MLHIKPLLTFSTTHRLEIVMAISKLCQLEISNKLTNNNKITIISTLKMNPLVISTQLPYSKSKIYVSM